MTDAQKTAKLVVSLANENRLLRQREKKLKRILGEALACAEGHGFMLRHSDVARWRKALQA